MKKLLACYVVLVLAACGGGGGGSGGNHPAPQQAQSATLSGTLRISAFGQSQVIETDEVEPVDDGTYVQALTPLAPGMTHIVRGSIAPYPDDDVKDAYWLTEPSAQDVSVTMSHDAGADFDIIVYDIDKEGNITEMGSSAGTASPEQVDYYTPAPAPGESHVTAIAVTWFEGSGSYELCIEAKFHDDTLSFATAENKRNILSTGGSDHPVPSLETVWDVSGLDAVPGEVLVKLRVQESSALEAASLSQTQATRNWGRMTPCGEVPGIATLMCLESGYSASVASIMPGQPEEKEAQLRRTIGQVLRLRANPLVKDAIPNHILHEYAVPNDEFYPLQWHYPMIGLPEAWDTSTGSSDVVVAVLDTGVTAHPDLSDRLIPGYDFIRDPERSLDGDGMDTDPTDVGDRNIPTGASTWHGTHVAGTIGAATNNGRGVAGVDWHCRIMPIRALGHGGGDLQDIMNGILYAAGLSNASGKTPDKRADIINMSFGILDPNGEIAVFFQDVVSAARQAGVLMVAAAGNQNTSIPTAPADCSGVLSVAAVDLNRSLAPYSNYGSTTDMAAPGGDLSGADINGDSYPDGVLSTLVDENTAEFNYAFYEGTSMAAPHVAGVAALCLAANPNLTVGQLENLLLSTATDLGTPGRDDIYGYGLINAAAAVGQAAGANEDPNLEISPSTLNFGSELTRLEVSIVNTGAGTITVSPPVVTTDDGGNWLSAELQSSPPGVIVQVDRKDLPIGRYAGRITLSSNGGTRVIEVGMEVADDISPPDVGVVFVLLVDSETRETIKQTDTTQADAFSYQIEGVMKGSYLLIAGTDVNDNGLICEPEDFCGAYPVLNAPSPIDVNQGDTITDLNFQLTLMDSGLDTAAITKRDDSTMPVGIEAGRYYEVRRLR